MNRLLATLVVLCAAKVAHGQLAWVVDTTFKTDIEWYSIRDLEFRDEGILVSGDLHFAGIAGNQYSALLDYNGDRITTYPGWGGGGPITPWGDRFYIGNGIGVVRQYWDGSSDPTFPPDTPFMSYVQTNDYYMYPNGKVLLAGSFGLWSLADTSFLGYNFCLFRLDTLGLPDTTFHAQQSNYEHPANIQPLPNGQFLLSGWQTQYDGQPVGNIWRIFADGSLDTTFRSHVDYGYATDYYFYPDGRILCSGWFHTPELPNDTVQLIRLMPDGSLDTSFNYELHFELLPDIAYPPGVIEFIHNVEPNTLFIGGSFSTLNGAQVGGIAAIDTSGNILPQYFQGAGCDSMAFGFGPNPSYYLGLRNIEMGPDSALYAYGFFNGFDDGYHNYPDQQMIVKLVLRDVSQGVEEPVHGTLVPLKVYPNPASTSLTIETHVFGVSNGAVVVLRDILGREVGRMAVPKGKSQQVWDVRDRTPGAYTAELAGNGGTLATQRFMIRP